ncbi:MAG TPA: nucleotide exchange factor GrpE [Blastocatellia bacterium]|nr:nucleotide exchange factor GrpE [Blastocatellia bacterium]
MGKKEIPINAESAGMADKVAKPAADQPAVEEVSSVQSEPKLIDKEVDQPDAEKQNVSSTEQSSEQREIELALALAEAQDTIQTLWQDKSNLHDQLLRRQAEFENFRKRQEKEKIEFHQRARAELVLELLPVLDNFERALSSLNNGEAEAGSLRQGIELIHKQMRDALTKLGLQTVESVGAVFDPNLHEAVTTEPTEDHKENTIIEEFQRGYKLGDRLLRPAKVKVAAAPEK